MQLDLADRWGRLSDRTRHGVRYLGLGCGFIAIAALSGFLAPVLRYVAGMLALGFTMTGLALMIWGDIDVTDQRSHRQ